MTIPFEADFRYVRKISTEELERRVRYLSGLDNPRRAGNERRAHWIKGYKRELNIRKEMFDLAERVKARAVKDLEVQLGVARSGAEKDSTYKDWYERRVEVFEAELARREQAIQLTRNYITDRFDKLSDDDLAFWSRYYHRKLDSTDDLGWIKKWSCRLMAVEREQNLRQQAKGRINRVKDAQDNMILHHITATIDFTIDNKELLELITGGTIMNWSVNEPTYPLTRRLLRNNRYSVDFRVSGVSLGAGQDSYNLNQLSEELSALDIPHAINVNAAGKKLTAELTTDAFKRLLAKLL